MANLFRLLGLPDPSKATASKTKRKMISTDPGPQEGDLHIDLGEMKWSERTLRHTPSASRNVVYLKPDGLHRLSLEGMSLPLSRGCMVIVDLGSLAHMPSQKDVCKRARDPRSTITMLPLESGADIPSRDSLCNPSGFR